MTNFHTCPHAVVCLLCLITSGFHATEDVTCPCAQYSGCDFSDCVRENDCRKKNIAPGKEATMSSTWFGGWPSGPACLGVDGKKNTTYLPPPFANCFSTASDDLSPSWQVDLGDNYSINSLLVYTADKSTDEMHGVSIFIDNNICYTFDESGNVGTTVNITFSQNLTGRIIKFQKSAGIITFCELEVWVPSCPCAEYSSCNFTKQCVPEDNCRKENIAPGKRARMSSVWSGQAPSGPACLGVDGVIRTQYAGTPTPNCFSTASNDNSPYWEVDLGGVYTIESFRVYTTDTDTDKMQGVSITVDSELCQTYYSEQTIQQIVDITCGQILSGRIVRFTKPVAYITFCELQILVCMSGYYGRECNKSCGQCRNGNTTCDKATGFCPSGCQNGWALPYCDRECDFGYYGENCSLRCGNCINGTTCDTFSGKCSSGCEAGWQPPNCKKGCKAGYYGNNCNSTCGKCLSGNTCDRFAGYCPFGCQSGWNPPNCLEGCENGFYGQSCNSTCGNCNVNNKTCDRFTGTCHLGCDIGWQSHNCKNVCDNGFYGLNCKHTCGNCTGGRTCHHITGHCPSGCETGLQPPECQNECADGKYGFNCNNTCGMCFNGTSACDPIIGMCFFGCDGTYQPPWCHEEFKDMTNLNVTALASGLSAGIMFIIAIVIFVILFRRRQQRSQKRSETDTSQNVERHSESVKPRRNTLNISTVLFKGMNSKLHGRKRTPSVKSQQDCPPENAYACINDKGNINKAEVTSTNESWINDAHPLYGNIMQPDDIKSMSLSHFDRSQTQRLEVICQATSDAEVNNAVIVSLEHTPSVYENVQAASRSRTHLGDIEISDKVKSTQPVLLANNSDINMFEENDTNDGDESEIYRNEDIYSSYNPDCPALLFDSLQRSLLNSLASGQLSKQFMNLPTGMKHPYNEGRKPSNMKKNRFKAIFPYDHNRVILNRGDDDTKADYINASYIKGFQREKTYIATQGPRPHTINDMWWMVWQENVTHIVMLTNLKEDGKDKCEEYWPAPQATQAYGPIKVSCINVDPRADFVIRTFTLQFKGNTLLRQVEQYQYVSWPDHGVPRVSSLVNLWRYVKARAILQVPLLVHCSAGVGRTGTYIALDIAMEAATRRHEVNVEKIVTELREERSMMVQAEAQYKFLYEVILEAYTSRKSRLTLEQFSASFLASIDVHESNQFIDKEFKMLQHMGRFQPKPKYVMATLEENLNKIRNVHNLPDDDHLAYISLHVNGRNAFINAVYISSFQCQKGIIMTQLPLPDTLVDLWRLIEDKGIQTIVSIGAKDDQATVQNHCQYWPKTAGDVLHIGPYTVSLIGHKVHSTHVSSFLLSFKRDKLTREVHLFHYMDWVGEVPEGGTGDLIHLMETLDNRPPSEDSPVIIQCIDGVTKSGLFCALWENISRAKCDQETDIYLTARRVQSVTPNFITSEVQYRYCYRVVQDYLHNLAVYENT